MNRTAFILVALALLALSTRAWADSDLGTPPQSDRRERFQDAALGVGFAYDPDRWVQATADQGTTRHVVDWRGGKQRDLIATCSLQAFERPEWARLPEELVHVHLTPIAQAVMAEGQMTIGYEGDPDMVLVGKRAIYADDYPVVLLERRTAGRGPDIDTGMTVIGEFTVWRGHSVLLDCGYPDAVREDGNTHDSVRDEILRILSSLHFER